MIRKHVSFTFLFLYRQQAQDMISPAQPQTPKAGESACLGEEIPPMLTAPKPTKKKRNPVHWQKGTTCKYNSYCPSAKILQSVTEGRNTGNILHFRSFFILIFCILINTHQCGKLQDNLHFCLITNKRSSRCFSRLNKPWKSAMRYSVRQLLHKRRMWSSQFALLHFTWMRSFYSVMNSHFTRVLKPRCKSFVAWKDQTVQIYPPVASLFNMFPITAAGLKNWVPV